MGFVCMNTSWVPLPRNLFNMNLQGPFDSHSVPVLAVVRTSMPETCNIFSKP